MKKTILNIILTFFTAIATFAATDARIAIGVSEPEVGRVGDRMNVSMTLLPHDLKLHSGEYVKVTPVLKSEEGNDSIVFPSVTIAGKNAWYNLTRNTDNKSEMILRANKDRTVSYRGDVAWFDWMEFSKLSLRHEKDCCGRTIRPVAENPLAYIDYRPMEYVSAGIATVAPLSSGPKQYTISGRAYVNFPVNRTEIFPEYMNNVTELGKITETIRKVNNNPDMTIEAISLRGYASPEGPWNNNVRLAEGRTQAVKEYVRTLYKLDENIMKTSSVPEDWDGLREYVDSTSLNDRDGILALIDDKSIADAERNDELRKRFPESYSFLLKNEYPWLRHTDYEIKYIVRKYTDIEEIKKILKTAPAQLDLSELYQAAESYGAGTLEFDEVVEIAVRLYPDDPVANLNAAVIAINEKRFDGAASLLAKAGDSGYAEKARATLEALLGNYDNAMFHFDNAARKGMEVSEEKNQLERLKNRAGNPVRYAIDK